MPDGMPWHPLQNETPASEHQPEDDGNQKTTTVRIDKEEPGIRLKPRCLRRGHTGHR